MMVSLSGPASCSTSQSGPSVAAACGESKAPAARHVLDEQIRIARAQRIEDLIEAGDLREVAVARLVTVAGAVAVHPQVVVPFQVVGMNGVDERAESIEHPLAARRPRQADE